MSGLPSGLRELLGKATPGPWEFSYSPYVHGHKGEFRAPSPFNGFMLVGPWTNDADVALIVAAVNALPALLDVEEAAEEAQRALSAEYEPNIDKGWTRATAVLDAALARYHALTQPEQTEEEGARG